MEIKTVTISNWNKLSADRRMLKQVVVKTPNGKDSRGKEIYRSQTKHVPIG